MKVDSMKFSGITLILWIGLSLSASAAEPEEDSSKHTQQPAVGTSTTEWLDMQREGRAAGNLLTIPGAEAGPSYKRYIDSFATPIPEQLGAEMPGYGVKR